MTGRTGQRDTHASPLMLALYALGSASATPGAHAPHWGVSTWLLDPVASFNLHMKIDAAEYPLTHKMFPF